MTPVTKQTTKRIKKELTEQDWIINDLQNEIRQLKAELAEKNRKIDECPKGGKYYKKDFDASKVDLCPHCNCMTHTIGRAECGKCHQDKRILIMSKEKE